jgi:putative transcriptional regulator
MARDPLAIDLGRRLRVLRTARKLTQQGLAAQADVALGAVKHLENGDPATTLSLIKVLRVLGVESWIEAIGPTETPFSPLAMAAGRRPAGPPHRVGTHHAGTSLGRGRENEAKGARGARTGRTHGERP